METMELFVWQKGEFDLVLCDKRPLEMKTSWLLLVKQAATAHLGRRHVGMAHTPKIDEYKRVYLGYTLK